MGYDLEGRLVEVCSCATYCPCTAGLEPDGGSCDFNWVFHVDRGTVGDVDVAGLNLGFIGRINGTPGPGTAWVMVLVDERASADQQAALLAAWTGKEGGPLADLASMVAEVVAVERAEIDFDVERGTGHFRIGELAGGGIAALTAPNGEPTTIVDSAMSGLLGRTAYIGRPTDYRLDAGRYGFALVPRSSAQFEFHYAG